MKLKNLTRRLLEAAEPHGFAEPFMYLGETYRKFVIEYYPDVGKYKWGIFRDDGDGWTQVGYDIVFWICDKSPFVNGAYIGGEQHDNYIRHGQGQEKTEEAEDIP